VSRATPPQPRLHRGLVWLAGDPAELELLAADAQLAALVRARPHPGLLGFAEGAADRVTARLAKLGTVPRRVVPT